MLLRKQTLVDIRGVLIGCNVNNFILSSTDMGGGKGGIKLEFLSDQFNDLWDVQVGDALHARCVIEGGDGVEEHRVNAVRGRTRCLAR